MAPGVEHDEAWWAGECELMELTRRYCAHCRKLPDVPVLDLDERSPGPEIDRGPSLPFVARFEGRCSDCGHSITPGDMIRRGASGFVCEGCS